MAKRPPGRSGFQDRAFHLRKRAHIKTRVSKRVNLFKNIAERARKHHDCFQSDIRKMNLPSALHTSTRVDAQHQRRQCTDTTGRTILILHIPPGTPKTCAQVWRPLAEEITTCRIDAPGVVLRGFVLRMRCTNTDGDRRVRAPPSYRTKCSSRACSANRQHSFQLLAMVKNQGSQGCRSCRRSV